MPDLPRPPADAVPDAALLARYARDRDPAAFELLVWRHRRLVLGTARRVVGNRADAEDAAQAAFLVLARKADRVGPNLPGWLHTVAYRCAAKLRKASGGRQPPDPARVADYRRDQGADAPRSPEEQELLAALDDELHRLPDRYRTPLVLCYLHGLTYPEAAARLNLPVGTLSGRLTRGKEQLRRRLVRRGVAAVALPAVLDALPASADTLRTADIARAALAFAAGEPAPTAALANGVLRAMTLKSLAAAAAVCAFAVSAFVGTVALSARPPADPPKPTAGKPVKTDKERMQGEWVFESATMPGGADAITNVWESRLIIAGDTIAITKYKVPFTDTVVPELKTKFTLTPTKTPREIDLEIPELAVTVFGKDLAGGPLQGIYRLEDDDTLTICLADRPRFPRPTVFDAKESKERFLFTVKRSKQPGAATPKQATLRVLDPDGTPVAGAQAIYNGVWTRPDEWGAEREYHHWQTGADGRVELRPHAYTVWHPGRRLMGLTGFTPAGLVNQGEQAARLQPEGRLTVRVRCPELRQRSAELSDSLAVLMPIGYEHNAAAVAGSHSKSDTYRFIAPPGEYLFQPISPYFEGRWERRVSVASGDTTAPPVEVPASSLGKLLGRPAPEFTDVAAWKNGPIRMADLKGKPVLLAFWYLDDRMWPRDADWLADLFALSAAHEDRGLEVVLVAEAIHGEEATAERVNRLLKLAAERTNRKGIDFGRPVRVAVVQLQRSDAPIGTPRPLHPFVDAYGVRLHPSPPVLIDREGKVVGLVDVRDVPAHRQLFEKVVGGK